MDYEREIRNLKASLLETKLGVAGLAVCIAQTLVEHDPSLRERLTRNFEEWHRTLGPRQLSDAKEIAVTFGRALFDPAFPQSSTPPDDLD